jgi:pseudouridylate synthase
MDTGVVSDAIEKSLAEASARGIKGKEITPYLLSRVMELTGGSSLEANIALVENNVLLGSRTVAAYTLLGSDV